MGDVKETAAVVQQEVDGPKWSLDALKDPKKQVFRDKIEVGRLLPRRGHSRERSIMACAYT